jgi:hypothetical protein
MTTPPLNRLEIIANFLRENAKSNSFYASVLSSLDRFGSLTIKQIEAVEASMAKAKASAPASVNPVTEIGMYRNADGVVYRVKYNKDKSGMYAMRFVPEGTTKSERIVFERGAFYRLTASMRMTVAECAELGLLYSMCVICGADLTDPKSVARGMGSTCAGKV